MRVNQLFNFLLQLKSQLCPIFPSNNFDSYNKYTFVLGMPGSGKTFIDCHALFDAMCKGLNVMISALSSERSMNFGGSHIHEVFN